jgi:dienelactone hydrolase
VAARQVRASRERVADVLAARNWLQAQRDVKPEAISLMGWSNGGATVLAAIREDRKPADGAPDIARAVAFYPGCRGQAESPMFRARVPLLILMGAADDWTPPAPCISLARAAALRGENVELRLYADAYHDFDHPERRLTQRSGLAFSAGEAGTATIGTNDEARRDAIARVPNFLAR